MKVIPIYRIRIVYKSGHTQDFDCVSFKFERTRTGTDYSWEAVNHKNRPLLLGGDEIAAVWQIGVKKKVIWGA